MPNQKRQLPLVLLIATRRAERHVRRAVIVENFQLMSGRGGGAREGGGGAQGGQAQGGAEEQVDYGDIPF